MYKLTVFCLLAVSILGCTKQVNKIPIKPSEEYKVAAYYWPAYHDEPCWRPFFKGKEGEWEIIRNAKPKFEGHYQPRVPLWGFEDESDPKVMEKKIEAATNHGVNIFIFDWYWYEGKPFLEECINEGFLKAKNNSKISFYLMWANHDATTLWDLQRSHKREVIWPGGVNRANFNKVVDRVIERYMKHPSYYKIDGKPVFSIFYLDVLINGLGDKDKTKDALDYFREKVKEAGFPGLHLQVALWKIPPSKYDTVRYLGFDSLTHYQWAHCVVPKGDYEVWAKQAMEQWEPLSKEFSIPFFPHVSIGWDTNPRFKSLMENTIVNQSPDVFADCLQKAKEFVDQHSIEPKLITINSWNEWSEGSYLEPDKKFGMGHLKAVREVFKN